MERKRIVYLDYLRVIACFAVVLLHVCGEYYNSYPAESIQWRELNFLDGMTRWSVPLFVMISGAAVLGRGYSVEKIKKAIIRFGGVYIFWSIVYAAVAFVSGQRLKEVFSILILGDTHMWFIPMIMGLYILIPLLDNVIEDTRLSRYFVRLAFVIAIVLPTCATVVNCFSPYLGEVTKTFISNMGISFVAGYTGYFVLGRYLSVQSDCTTNRKRICYALGIVGCALTILIPRLVSSGSNYQIWAYGNLTLNVFFQVVAIFIFAKSTFNLQSVNRFMKELAANSFGVYLIHLLFVKLVGNIVSLEKSGGWSFVIILVITVVVFAISNVIVSLVRRCPAIKKVV